MKKFIHFLIVVLFLGAVLWLTIKWSQADNDEDSNVQYHGLN